MKGVDTMNQSYEILSPPEEMENRPTLKELNQLEQGDLVKLIFHGIENHALENMWVMILKIKGNEVLGVLDNHPFSIEGLEEGDDVHFTLDQIISIY